MTYRILLLVSFFIVGTSVFVAPASAQCTTAGVNDPSPQYDACNGGNPNEIRYTRKTFSMSSSVACSQGGYIGTGFGGDTAEVAAIGACGNAPASAPPDCAGNVGGASAFGLVGSVYRWQVSRTGSYWTGSGCGYFSPTTQEIEVYAEGCTGSFCCDQEDRCIHLSGNWSSCNCYFTPVILGLDRNEMRLTDAKNGVLFDLLPDGTKEQVAWTRRGSRDAFLALDRNENGTIDNGYELFGSSTIQPPIDQRNGFNALTPFDLNGDRVIDNKDPIYSLLRTWTDRNHNGESESTELKSLVESGIASIGIDYDETNRIDRQGNAFKFVSTIHLRAGKRLVERRAWDVVLTTVK